MRHLVLTLLCVSSSAFAADLEVAIDVPQHLPAWSTASVKVVVRNRSAHPISPLAIELASDAGTLMAWGIDGTCRGALHTCSIQMRWAAATPARRRDKTWELLLGGPMPQQRMEPPDTLSQAATEQLVRLEPIAAGATIDLEIPFVAMYQHGGALTATVSYVVVDPKALALCTATQPAQKAFVPCTRIDKLAGDVYAAHADLTRAQKPSQARKTFVVDHPAFDVADARTVAKVTAGAYGYERRDQRWILVDGARTIVVGADGKLDTLPGDWLDKLVELDSSETTSAYWNASSAADAKRIATRLGADHVSFAPFAFKGNTSADRFIVTFKRAEVTALAASMRALGYRMVESSITK